ncbi:cadherin-like beta sandwich domain-containing protein, partial [Lachnoclostridium sp.]
MKIWYKKSILSAICLLLGFLLMNIPSINSMAASATIKIEVPNDEVDKGEEFKITIVIASDSILGDFEGYLSYNAEIIEFISGPSCVSGGNGMLRFMDTNASSSDGERRYVLRFKALEVGNCQLLMTGNPIAYEFETGDPMSVSAYSGSVTIRAKEAASKNTNLAMLKVSPGTLTPSFKSTVKEYSIMVGPETEKIIISAIPEDTAATVGISGNDALKIGNNTIVITVTAQSGNTDEYRIQVLKEESNQQVEEIPNEGGDSPNLKAVRDAGKTTIFGQFKYTVVSDDSNIIIPKGYVKSSILVDGCTIPIYQKKDSLKEDYLLMILENQFGNTSLYRYDRTEKTIQLYTEQSITEREDISPVTSNNLELKVQKKEFEEKISQLTIVIIVLCGIC